MLKKQKLTINKREIEISFTCASCSKAVRVTMDNISWDSKDQDCEICGSHGNVNMCVACPSCNYFFDVELSSW